MDNSNFEIISFSKSIKMFSDFEPLFIGLQLRANANGRLPFYEAKVLFSEGRGRM